MLRGKLCHIHINVFIIVQISANRNIPSSLFFGSWNSESIIRDIFSQYIANYFFYHLFYYDLTSKFSVLNCTCVFAYIYNLINVLKFEFIYHICTNIQSLSKRNISLWHFKSAVHFMILKSPFEHFICNFYSHEVYTYTIHHFIAWCLWFKRSITYLLSIQ